MSALYKVSLAAIGIKVLAIIFSYSSFIYILKETRWHGCTSGTPGQVDVGCFLQCFSFPAGLISLWS